MYKYWTSDGMRLRRVPPRHTIPLWNLHQATLNGEDRTNNTKEGWNNRFVHIVGLKHPSVWILISELQKEDGCTRWHRKRWHRQPTTETGPQRIEESAETTVQSLSRQSTGSQVCSPIPSWRRLQHPVEGYQSRASGGRNCLKQSQTIAIKFTCSLTHVVAVLSWRFCHVAVLFNVRFVVAVLT